MTSTATIRSALADLWDTGANAYDLAEAVMKAAYLESADLELEVESVISRALLAREFVDVAKVAAEVAKVLPESGPIFGATDSPDIGEHLRKLAEQPLPLCERIVAEVDDARRTGHRPRAWMRIDDAQAIIRKHFAALSVGGG